MLTQLSTHDVLAVLEFVGDVHHAETLDDFRAALLPAVRHLVPCDWVSYNEVDADGTVHAALVQPGADPRLHAAWSRYALQNPIVAHYQQTRDGRAYRLSDFLTRDELHSLELYRYVYAPMGVEYQVAVALPSAPDITIGVALSRGDRDFTDRDRGVLDLARPHVIQAWRNARIGPARGRLSAEAIRAHLCARGLSEREADVLQRFMAGASTAAVAAELQISTRTVHKHAERIHAKLGAGTRAEAIARAWTELVGPER